MNTVKLIREDSWLTAFGEERVRLSQIIFTFSRLSSRGQYGRKGLRRKGYEFEVSALRMEVRTFETYAVSTARGETQIMGRSLHRGNARK
jgi:hypothetical protein